MTTTAAIQPESSNSEEWLTRQTALGLTPAALMLLGIIALAAFLNFYQLENIGDANLYYSAAVESMLQSWHNFLFVAAEPGGSVTIDKPPLGLWLEAASAFIFGVNGFAVVLPNILSGLASIPIMYHITRNYFGTAAGLAAALVMAVTPVAIAAQRNNTMDGMLTLALVLAAWAFLKAAESGRLRFLLLGAVVVGLGFNIKMLQAFLPLPAFLAVYFLGARLGGMRNSWHLALAILLLLAVSLSWAIAVDLTPAEQRPYIGSSTDNSVMELILGHNGLNRWFGGGGARNRAAGDGQPPGLPSGPAANAPGPGRFAPDAIGQQQSVPSPPGVSGRPMPPDAAGQFVLPDGQPQDGAGSPPVGAPGGSNEVGQAGVLRFFVAPLSKEMSWLLPLGIVGALLVLLRSKLMLPLQRKHQFLLVWGGWLSIAWAFFSWASFFHAYYLVMLAPPLAALAGAGVGELWQMRKENWLASAVLLLATAVATLVYQWFNAAQFTAASWWQLLALGLLVLGSVLLLNGGQRREQGSAAFVIILAALAVIPLAWSYLTTTDVNNVNLPGAYAGIDEFAAPDRNNNRRVDAALLAYLQANTQDTRYLMAVPGSMQGASYVLETGRPVLYMGGFNGGDPVVDAADIAHMVAQGALRFVMISGGGGNQQAIGNWVRANCTAVTQFSAGDLRQPNPGGSTLFQCGS